MTEETKPPVCEKHGCEKKWVKDKGLKAGGRWKCGECSNECVRRWRLANPEKSAQQNLRSKQKNSEQAAVYFQGWYKRNKSKSDAQSAAWRSENPKKIADSDRQYRQKNPQKICAATQRRRARKRTATVPGQPVTAEVIAERVALFDGCAYCGAEKQLEIEHFIALSDGGLHILSNLLGCCRSCNSRKKDKPVEEWFRAQPFFSEKRWQELLEVTAMSQERQHSQKNNLEG